MGSRERYMAVATKYPSSSSSESAWQNSSSSSSGAHSPPLPCPPLRVLVCKDCRDLRANKPLNEWCPSKGDKGVQARCTYVRAASNVDGYEISEKEYRDAMELTNPDVTLTGEQMKILFHRLADQSIDNLNEDFNDLAICFVGQPGWEEDLWVTSLNSDIQDYLRLKVKYSVSIPLDSEEPWACAGLK